MRFSENVIEAAHWLRQSGRRWSPSPGQFVFDEASAIEHPSLFQERVYLILDS